MSGEYREDTLRMTSDTELDEVLTFIKQRARNPYTVNGKIIWDFSNHKPDMEALEFATENKLENDEYVIPFQVTGTWGFIIQLLPERLRNAEILVFKKQYGDYAAYENMYRLMEEKDEYNRDDFISKLEDDVASIGRNDAGD